MENDMDYQALKDEVTNNPKDIPDLSWDQTDQWIADTLNTIGISNETIARELVNTADIITAIYSDKTEFMSISQINLVRLNLLSPVGDVDPMAIQNVIKEIFPEPAFENIRVALIALVMRPASRAEKLFAQSLSVFDVHKARRT